jgi:hypothetical protein
MVSVEGGSQQELLSRLALDLRSHLETKSGAPRGLVCSSGISHDSIPQPLRGEQRREDLLLKRHDGLVVLAESGNAL